MDVFKGLLPQLWECKAAPDDPYGDRMSAVVAMAYYSTREEDEKMLLKALDGVKPEESHPT